LHESYSIKQQWLESSYENIIIIIIITITAINHRHRGYLIEQLSFVRSFVRCCKTRIMLCERKKSQSVSQSVSQLVSFIVYCLLFIVYHDISPVAVSINRISAFTSPSSLFLQDLQNKSQAIENSKQLILEFSNSKYDTLSSGCDPSKPSNLSIFDLADPANFFFFLSAGVFSHFPFLCLLCE